MKKYLAEGQIGLLLLVIMGVVVAVVMSVASRSLSDTTLSRQERESSAVFAVVETGIEKAMTEIKAAGDQPISGALTGLSSFVSGTYTVTPSAAYGLFVREGETAQLDFTGYDVANPLTIMWTKKGDTSEDLVCGTEGSGGSAAAIEIVAIQDAANTATRDYYNPGNCNYPANGFSSSTDLSTIDTAAIYRSGISSGYTVPVGTTVLRIKPIYAGATISVTGVGLSSQLYLIQSKAEGGDAKKEVEVKRGLDAPPSIFDFAVFSADTLIK